MATLAAPEGRLTAERRERRFFLVMAMAMSATIVAGFSIHLALGRSSFAVPAIVHLHAVTFMGWLGLYVAQSGLIASGNVLLHRRLGLVAFAMVPLMVILGAGVMTWSLRDHGGPFFFDQNEFLVSNFMLLLAFAGLVIWALRTRRHQGWHRRLMLVAMTILTGPGLGRLLPGPLMIPYAWEILFAATLVFPIIGMIADRRRHGSVHPAYLWGTGAMIAVFLASLAIAETPWAIDLTRQFVAGTPGAARPMEAFLPPGFAG